LVGRFGDQNTSDRYRRDSRQNSAEQGTDSAQVRLGASTDSRADGRWPEAFTEDWKYDVISIGFVEPHDLGKAWVGFNYEPFDCRAKMINDDAMQTLGSYKKGKVLFLGPGTGIGTAFPVNGIVEAITLLIQRYRKYKES
jgi:hypothetical protein